MLQPVPTRLPPSKVGSVRLLSAFAISHGVVYTLLALSLGVSSVLNLVYIPFLALTLKHFGRKVGWWGSPTCLLCRKPLWVSEGTIRFGSEKVYDNYHISCLGNLLYHPENYTTKQVKYTIINMKNFLEERKEHTEMVNLLSELTETVKETPVGNELVAHAEAIEKRLASIKEMENLLTSSPDDILGEKLLEKIT